MTTNLNPSTSKSRDRHSTPPTNRSARPSSAKPETGQGSGKSADEIRETVKEAVGKGVSAVAGAVEGVAETMEETQLAETAQTAIHQVGGTVNKVVSAAKEETQNLKSALKGEGTDSGSDEDYEIERDDPTFAGKAFTPTNPLPPEPLAAAPLSYGADDEQSSTTYTPEDEDDESQGI